MPENRCAQCETVIPPSGRPGRPPSFCGDDCRRERGRSLNKFGRQRGSRVFLPCSGCAKPMQITWSSAAVMTCNPCRRARAEANRPPVDHGPWQKTCAANDCEVVFTAKQRSRRFCSQDCLVGNHRAMERIRDAERRRQRKTETPAEALVWFGSDELGAVLEGPQQDTVTVSVSIGNEYSRSYDVRCPGCHCLTQFLAEYALPPQWGCYRCYCKYVLVTEPVDREPYGWCPDGAQAR